MGKHSLAIAEIVFLVYALIHHFAPAEWRLGVKMALTLLLLAGMIYAIVRTRGFREKIKVQVDFRSAYIVLIACYVIYTITTLRF